MRGKYPEEMREILGSDLPVFSKHEVEKLKNGVDFIGLNHYTSFYIKDCKFSPCEPGPGNSKAEGFAFRTAQNYGAFIGQKVSKPHDVYTDQIEPLSSKLLTETPS